MDKEKEIEEMSTTIISNADENLISCSLFTAQKISEWLVNAGYGNVNQAVKEFAEKLKAEINDLPKEALTFSIRHQAPELIDKTFKELYGEGDNES